MRGLMVGEEIDKNQAAVSCPKCGTSNTPSANFCSNCSLHSMWEVITLSLEGKVFLPG